MKDYEPVDISKSFNSGVEALGEVDPMPSGLQSFQGLPFLMGDGVIALDSSKGAVTIPIGQSARSVIFAHSLCAADLTEVEVEPIGQQVAEYIFRLSGGDEVRVPIRGRFEIASLPGDATAGTGGAHGMPGLPFGKGGTPGTPARPFNAVMDEKYALLSRYSGLWEEMGRRQTESMVGGVPSWSYLWCWSNPRPETTIESMEIVPAGQPFAICAITLGHVDETPFPRQGRRPIGVELKDPAAARQDFDLDVQVDRGVATYPHPLPEASAQEFLAAPLKGWGEQQNRRSSPAYVEVSATPSATVSVRHAGKEVGTVNWGEVEAKGAVETPAMRVTLLDRGKNWVHVNVLDDDTGKPVPCRVHFRSPDGVPYQPYGYHGHLNSNLGTWHIDVGGDVRLGQITYAVIDGTCQGWLPRGDVIVDVARGFEYDPLRTVVKIEPGQRELNLRIKRWIDMNSRRWFSGDSHVHFLTLQGSHTESQAEDLNVVNLLQSQWGSLFTNQEDFTGAPSVWQKGNNIVYVGQENRQNMGHMNLLGLKRPVMPWCTDGPGVAEIGGTMETMLSHWADEAHAQGGYVISPHFPMPNGEQAALIATGRLDGVEMYRQAQINHGHYYRYLNCGYRLPLVGGTDKMSGDVPVGIYRGYVYIPEDEEFNYDNWCRNVARGRTFFSSGPILHFTVDGHEIGDTATISSAGTVEVEAWAESIFPIHRLEIVQGGRVVASTESRDGARRLEIREKIRVDGHTWLAARCGGPSYFDGLRHHDVWTRGIFAHTSPIYVACGGDWWMFDESVAQYMLTMIEGNLTHIREMSLQQNHADVTHHHGEDDHIAYLERPLLEAQRAVEERVAKGGRP